MNLPAPPPKFLGQVGPQTPADWVSLQKWFVSMWKFVTGEASVNLAFSTNLPYDSPGTPDTRPGTWGNAAFQDVPFPFVNVPAGKRVQLMRIYGTFQGWAQNPTGVVAPIPVGSNAGILFGLLAEGNGQSPFVGPGLGSQGCSVYLQAQVGPNGCIVPFDFDVSAAGLLGPDNIMTIREALFLNNTGMSIHQEVSMVVEFQYVSA